MGLIARCVSYAAIICGLPVILGGGIHWLVAADPDTPHTLSTPPLPPRIAESIERRKEPLPPPIPNVPLRSAVVTAPLRQATASLHSAPIPRMLRDRHLEQTKSPGTREDMRVQAIAAPAPQAMITTARSDVPY